MASMRGLEGNNTNPSIPASDTPSASSALPESNSPPKHTFAPRTSSLPAARRSRAQSNASISSFKRKPLPSTASAIATRFSSAEYLVNKPDARLARPPSVEAPPLSSQAAPFPVPGIPEEFLGEQRNPSQVKEFPELDGLMLATPPTRAEVAAPSTNPVPPSSDGLQETSTAESHKHAKVPSEPDLNSASNPKARWFEDLTPSSLSRSATMSIFTTKSTPPQITLPSNGAVQSISNQSINDNKPPIPRSPGASKLGSFFGWVGNNSESSSIASASERGLLSPARSPTSPERRDPPKGSQPVLRSNSNLPRANADEENYFDNLYLQQSLSSMPANQRVDNMEAELKTIAQELATSIRREMELEDLVERLQAEAANPAGPGRRTSDYFSDSGTSSVKYAGDSEVSRTEELERLQRSGEREKAQIRMDLTAKVQEERSRREELEVKIRDLEEKTSGTSRDLSYASGGNGQVKDLEATCEDLRRRLNEERQAKENFQDLLKAMKNEVQAAHNERDNLREEVVPQLRARVEGLEAQAAEHEKIAYENTKMQQDMRSLKNENLPEAQAKVSRPNRPESLVLSRPSSFQWGESREILTDRVKDIEAQRDALHRALKSLLERQEHQNRETQKRVRQLEMERDRALTSSPKRSGFNHEVANLREEIRSLRQRADDAIEQKWECEKGLGGLKMGLDRAEEEVASLRSLLRESYMSVPANRTSRANSVTSDSLERAYRELKKAYSFSVERINDLEKSNPKDHETERAMVQLEQSLSAAIKERDVARKESHALRASVGSVQSSEKRPMTTETALEDELRGSAKRVEELTIQVRQQLASNATLRQRLAETVERQEKEQQENAARILFMQDKLKNREKALRAAQKALEEQIAQHEEVVRGLKEGHSAQLVRVKDSMLTPRRFSQKVPPSPMFTNGPRSPMFANGPRSPRLVKDMTVNALPSSPEDQTRYLKSRVLELEKALEEADEEMAEVVNRMNTAQIEVMELQNEREEAVRQTKKLQGLIEEARLNSFEGRFGTFKT